MNVKYFDLVMAALLALVVFVLASFQSGCQWEKATTFDSDTRTQSRPIVSMLVGCSTTLDGKQWAEAHFPGQSWEELGNIVAIAHYAGSYYPGPGYDYELRQIRMQDGKAIVSCDGAVDYVVFRYVE